MEAIVSTEQTVALIPRIPKTSEFYEENPRFTREKEAQASDARRQGRIQSDQRFVKP